MSIAEGNQIGGESEYETDPEQLAAIQQQAAAANAAKIQQEFEGDPSRLGDIRKEAEEAQTVRSAEQSYRMQREAEGNIREFAEQQQRQQRIQEEYGVGLQYAQNLASPKRGPYTFGSIVKGAATLVSPIASMPYKTVVLSKAAQAYGEVVTTGFSYISGPLREKQRQSKKKGFSPKRVGYDLSGSVVEIVGGFAALPGTGTVLVADTAKEIKRLSGTPGRVEDVISPERRSQQRLEDEYGISLGGWDKGLEEFEGRSKVVSQRRAGAEAVYGAGADVAIGVGSAIKREGTEWWHDPGYVKAEKVIGLAPYVGAYVFGAGFGAVTYRGVTGAVAKGAGRKAGKKGTPAYKEAKESAQKALDNILQPHELYVEGWIGRRVKKYPWLAAGYKKIYETPFPTEMIGEFTLSSLGKAKGVLMGGAVVGAAKVATRQKTRGAGTGSRISVYQQSQMEQTYSTTLTAEQKDLFWSTGTTERAATVSEWKTPSEFESMISGTKAKTYSGTPSTSIADTLLGKAKKTDFAQEVDAYAQGGRTTTTGTTTTTKTTGGRTTRAGTGGGGGGATGTGGGTTTTTTTRQDSSEGEESMFSYAENGKKPNGKVPTESENGKVPADSKNGRAINLGVLALAAGLKKEKPKIDRAKGSVDFSFGSDWTKTFKFDMAELSIGDIDPVNGAKQQGGSILGGSMFGDSILGSPSKNGGDLLGGSALGDSILGGSTSGGDMLGGSAFGDSFFGGGGSRSSNMSLGDSILGRPSKGGKLL